MKKSETFYFRIGECLAAMDAKNTARALLNKQVKLLYPKGRKLTEEDQLIINEKLVLIQLGVENRNENILEYKIRKKKEYKSILSQMHIDFPEYRRTLYAIIKERSQRIGDEKMKSVKLRSALTKSIYELLTPYLSISRVKAYEAKELFFFDFPHIDELIKEEQQHFEKTKFFFVNDYKNLKFYEIIQFILNTPEYFLSEELILRVERSLLHSEVTNKKNTDKLKSILSNRYERFLKIHNEYTNSLI